MFVSDHKPLDLIINNPSSKPPPRIERWAVRSQQYRYTVVYKLGKSNPSDFMSRHPTNSSEERENITEDYIHFIIDESVPKNMSLDEIETCTKHDELLQYVIDSVKKNDWHKTKAKLPENLSGDYMMYYRVGHELSI